MLENGIETHDSYRVHDMVNKKNILVESGRRKSYLFCTTAKSNFSTTETLYLNYIAYDSGLLWNRPTNELHG